jgi:protein-S-isoprenylcysteine O-methyltransferase Ste14
MHFNSFENLKNIILVYDNLSIFSLCFLWITAWLLLLSVVYKFVEYDKERKNKGKIKRKVNFVETLTMTFVIILIFNVLQINKGVFFVDFTTRLFAIIYGGVLGVVVVILHFWSKKAIGIYWSNQIEIIEKHKIITTGPYAIVRHPMYSSLILWLMGLSVMFLNYASFVITICVFVPMMIIRARAEDKLLKELDNATFGVYSREVKQLIPKFDGGISLLLRIIVITLLGYSLITKQMELARFFLLFFIHLLTGVIMKVPKISFSYINKSFIMLFIFTAAIFFKQAFWLYYMILIFDIWGLFWNCPCMFIYQKYNRCPCFDVIKNCVWKIKK